MEERRFHPLDYLSVVQRRKWWFILPLVVCTAIGGALAMFLPRTYRSTAEIGIADATLSPELLRGVQSLDASERSRAISQQLLSRTVLERVVREERLSPNRPVADTAASLRSRVEQNISVPAPIARSGGNRDGLESFRLGYEDGSPERAQRIANRLATVFVEENSKVKTQIAENTSEALAQQLRDSQERWKKLQEELRQKQEAFMGRLPGQMNANISRVNGARQSLDSRSTLLVSENERLKQVESTLRAMEEGVGSGALTSAGLGAIQVGQGRINELQRQLTSARAAGYTDIHPEVVRIKGELAEAEKDLKASRQTGGGSRDEILAVDPIYKQKIEERNALRIRIKQLQIEEGQARADIALYQSRVDSTPMVEQELGPLTQDHNMERNRVVDLTNKYQAALLVEDLARKQGGERFVVLNPAPLPTRPVDPDPLRLMMMAIAIGLVLGVTCAVGREFLDRSVHDARALQSEFEVPVLGEIPRIQGAQRP